MNKMLAEDASSTSQNTCEDSGMAPATPVLGGRDQEDGGNAAKSMISKFRETLTQNTINKPKPKLTPSSPLKIKDPTFIVVFLENFSRRIESGLLSLLPHFIP